MVGIVYIQRIGELLQLTVNVRPQRHGPLRDLLPNEEKLLTWKQAKTLLFNIFRISGHPRNFAIFILFWCWLENDVPSMVNLFTISFSREIFPGFDIPQSTRQEWVWSTFPYLWHSSEQAPRWSINRVTSESNNLLESWSNGATDKLTSFILCCSQLHKNVPNRQLYRWSRMVTRKYSLNSNAEGNFVKSKHKGSFRILKCDEICTWWFWCFLPV